MKSMSLAFFRISALRGLMSVFGACLVGGIFLFPSQGAYAMGKNTLNRAQSWGLQCMVRWYQKASARRQGSAMTSFQAQSKPTAWSCSTSMRLAKKITLHS